MERLQHPTTLVVPALLVVVLTASVVTTAAQQSVLEGRALLDEYCVTCHNERRMTAGLSLDQLDLEDVGRNAQIWEKVVRKLRGGSMPPINMPRPSPQTADAFVASLEMAIDRAALAAPDPGRPIVHRLNRTEYTNATRDLLAVDIDADALLPADESGFGFDNIADVLSLSPGLLERYLSAARKVSRLAVGDPAMRPVVATISISGAQLQSDRMSEDLPFGSRGGTAFRHYFPLDGEYALRIHLHRSVLAGTIHGFARREEIDVRLDGERVELFAVAGRLTPEAAAVVNALAGVSGASRVERDGPAGSLTHAQAVLANPRTADAGLETRFRVRAGTHVVGVTFRKTNAVGWLLEAGADVDVANDYGVTTLSLASGNGSESVVRMLLIAGADPNGALPSGETVLMTAANTGQVDVVRILLARGAHVDATEISRGQTALMWALSETHLDAAQALIAHGANVNARATSGFTPLMFAARQGDLEASRMLLARGADVHGAAEDGTTALLTATVRGYPDLVRLLLAEGADPNASGAGYTALHWAAGSWETELTGEFGLNAPTSKWAALAGLTGEAKLDLVSTLLAHGADLDVRTTCRVPRFGFSSGSSSPQFYGTLGATPFLLAAQAGDAAVMRALVAAGADPLIPTDANTTPLMQAAGISRVIGESHATEAGSLEAVKLAVELGADINAVDDAGNTALHGAATQGADTVVQFLVDQGAELDVRNAYGETPWMIVAGFGLRRGGVNIDHPITAEFLRTLGADTSH